MNIISLLGTVPPATSTGPASIDDLMWLFAALGLSTTAGLRAYLPLLAIGVSYYIDPNLLPLQSNFQLLHDPLVLGVLLVLTVIEFALDKAPGIDHLSDIIHTIIRPASGAIIMAGTHNTLSDVSPWLAAVAGGLLALSLHGIKATTRPVVTGTTVGHGNPVVSVIEDVLALGGTVLLLVLPLIGFIVLTIVLLLVLRLTRPLRRRLFGLGRRERPRGAGGAAPVAPAVAASPPPPPERQLGGLIGRAARGRAGSTAAAVPSPSLPSAVSAYGPIPLPMPGPAPAAGPVARRAAGVVGRAAAGAAGAAAGVAAGAAAGLGAAAAGFGARPGAGPAATAPTAPLPPPGVAPLPAGAGGMGTGTGTGTGDTTVQATNQAPYPPVAPNPVQPLGGQQAQIPTTTQPYPQPFPTPSQPPWNYPGNAPTLPGQQQP